MKETLIKLGTGLIAKLLRYALTGAGTAFATVTPDGKPVELEHVAAGLSAVVVALGWSLWEDYVKRKAATAAAAAPALEPSKRSD